MREEGERAQSGEVACPGPHPGGARGGFAVTESSGRALGPFLPHSSEPLVCGLRPGACGYACVSTWTFSDRALRHTVSSKTCLSLNPRAVVFKVWSLDRPQQLHPQTSGILGQGARSQLDVHQLSFRRSCCLLGAGNHGCGHYRTFALPSEQDLPLL